MRARRQSIQGIIECAENPSPVSLTIEPVVLRDRRPGERVMTLQRARIWWGARYPQAGASHDVREQKGNDPSAEILQSLQSQRSKRTLSTRSISALMPFRRTIGARPLGTFVEALIPEDAVHFKAPGLSRRGGSGGRFVHS
jgi:hypothetical protein